MTAANPLRPDLDLDKLRELAQAATPGPWWSDEFLAVMPGDGLPPDRRCPPEIALVNPSRGSREHQRADAAYIAEADPTTVQALLDRLQRAETALQNCQPIVHRAAHMGLCSQTHHEHLMLAARAALEGGSDAQ